MCLIPDRGNGSRPPIHSRRADRKCSACKLARVCLDTANDPTCDTRPVKQESLVAQPRASRRPKTKKRAHRKDADSRRERRSWRAVLVNGGRLVHRTLPNLTRFDHSRLMRRREFFRHSAMFGAAALVGGIPAGCSSTAPITSAAPRLKPFELQEMTVAELRQGMASSRFTASGLAKSYFRRIDEIDRQGPRLKSVIELNPDALAIAWELDRERAAQGPRGPLHGIPVLLKDNIDTQDRMMTTAGSLALSGSIAPHDAFLVERLRAAGAVLLGKTNLSEWANFRGSRSISGWSGRGGLSRNPYVTDRSTSGSSAGSAAAVSASLCAVAIGTETDGSIVSPSSYCGVVGLKPTVGLVSRSGVIPISSSQDTAGPMGRCVADVAALLSALTGLDNRDQATTASAGKVEHDYTKFLDAKALRDARIGVARSSFKMSRLVDSVLETALAAIKSEGAALIDVKWPSRQDLGDGESQER